MLVSSEKFTFAMVSHFHKSDSPTQPNCSHDLSIWHASKLIEIHKNLKGQLSCCSLQAMTTKWLQGCMYQFTFKLISCPRHKMLYEQLQFFLNNLWFLCDCPPVVCKICLLCFKADLLLTNHRCFARPIIFSIENWIFNVEFSIKSYSPTSRICYWFLSFNGNSKLPASISNYECFGPQAVPVIQGVMLVLTIRLGLKIAVSGCQENHCDNAITW